MYLSFLILANDLDYPLPCHIRAIINHGFVALSPRYSSEITSLICQTAFAGMMQNWGTMAPLEGATPTQSESSHSEVVALQIKITITNVTKHGFGI